MPKRPQFTIRDLDKVCQVTLTHTVPEDGQESDEHDVAERLPMVLNHLRRVFEIPVDVRMPEKLHDDPDVARFWLRLVSENGECIGSVEVMNNIVGIDREWRFDKELWTILENFQLPLHSYTS